MFQKTFGRKVNIVGLVIGLAVLLLTAFPQQGAIYAQSTGGSGITLGRGAINDIAWSLDGKQIAIASSVGVWLYQSAQLTDEPQLIPSTRDIYSVAFSPDSKTLAFAGGDQLVNVWDIASKQSKGSYKGHKGSIYGLTFSPDGKTIASSSTDQTVIIRDAATGSIKQTLKGHTDYVTSVAFSPDGKTIASASDDGTVKLWTVATGKELRTLKQPDGGSSYLVTVAFSPDGKTVLAGGHTSTAFFWTAATGTLIKAADIGVYNIYRVAFSHNGKTAVAAGSGDYAIHLLDASRGADNASLTGHKGDITALAFSPDGKSLISGDAVGSLRLWDVAGSTVTTTIEGQFGHDYQASALSPDSSLIAVSYYGDDLIRLWKTDGSGTVPVVLKGHSEGVYSLAFSADGTQLASGSGDYSIIVWDVSTGKTKTIIKNLPSTPYALSFSSDGSLIAAGSSGGIVTLLDAGTGDTVTTFTGHTSAIRSIRFSTDDKKIISVGDDGTIRLWDVPAK